MREKRELEHWNMRRKANAMKVDADFDIALHKGNGKKETRALSTLKQQREDSLYSRRFEWKQIQEETSKNNWQLKPKVSKAVYTTVPDVPKATKPTDITWTQAMTHYS